MEDDASGLKRMTMRSWRRGTKEMDLVLGPFADAMLAGMGPEDRALYDRVLDENDQDLLPMILGQQPAPEGLQGLIDRIASFARSRLAR